MLTYTLDGAWALELPDGNTLCATVPGSVLNELITHNLIPDPHHGENEYPTLRLFDNDYRYRRTFDVTPDVLACDHVELVFDGLDTVCDVTLNGQLVLKADNMHRVWRVDVKGMLKAQGNEIDVLCHAPNQVIADAFAADPEIVYDGSGIVHGTSAVRKAHYMFGWDWGPQLPDAGIWRSVRVEGYGAGRLAQVVIHQEHHNGEVQLTVTPVWEGAAQPCDITLIAPDGTTLVGEMQGDDCVFTVCKPELWWPLGLGSQPLYTVKVACTSTGEVQTRRIGLRTMTVSRTPDEWGEKFCFTVNGVDVFAMGADYIPQDNVIARVNPERTRRLLEDAALANFNSIRVWGGGYYPEDEFFDICDELGLIVWLDLMFACNVYRMTPHFEENIRQEATDNLSRVRHHACLGLICGNNEMETAWVDWDNVKGYSDTLRADYLCQFEEVLKEVSETTAPDVFYWPSSPSSVGHFDNPNDYDRGDVHCWDVWHGMLPFAAYHDKFPRFCSEFGFESFPDARTLRTFCDTKQDENVFSRVMESHQKCVGGNGKILFYLSSQLRYPTTLEGLSYGSQWVQGEAMRYGVEHWRRHRGRCMGAIYWQLNDCWPVASWASIDYFGRWKALHYAAKRFFAPVMVSAEQTGLIAKTAVSNDTRNNFDGALTITLTDPTGKVLHAAETAVHVPALTSKWLDTVDAAPYLDASLLHPEDNVALLLTLTDKQGVIVSENTVLFTPPKFFRFEAPQIDAKVEQDADGMLVRLSAKAFAFGVRLDVTDGEVLFDDNWFTLMPGTEKVVRVLRSDAATPDALNKALTIASMADGLKD